MWTNPGLAPQTLPRLAALMLAPTVLVSTMVAACGPANEGTAASYLIVFTLTGSPDDLATLGFRVVYDGGEFVGGGTSVTCDLFAKDDDETASFDDDDTDTLEVAIDASDNPLEEEADIVACEFEASEQPTSDNFTVTVLDAEDADGDPVDVDDVDVVVTSTDLLEEE